MWGSLFIALACVSCAMCELRMTEVMSSGTPSYEEYEEHNFGNLSLEVVGKVGQTG